MGALQVRLLGGFSLEHEGRVLPPLPTRTARSLLALLITRRDIALSRDYLSGTFWPDLPEARARRRLSHALWQVQQAIDDASPGSRLLVADADTVRFDDRIELLVDSEEFERLAAGSLGDVKGAIELYRGDLLAGIYDDWVRIERHRLRDLYADTLRKGCDAHKARGELREALSYARRLVAHDPLSEDAHRDVMRLSSLLGWFNDAIQQYEFCVSILAEELGADPAAETTMLYQVIVDRRAKGDLPFIPEPDAPLFGSRDVPMVGRSAERSAVIERMERTYAGKGGVVIVEGHPGSGVTRFLRALADDAHWRGLGVLQAAAVSNTHPYDLARQILRGALSPLRVEQLRSGLEQVWLDAAADIIPELGPAIGAARLEPEDEGRRIAQALTEVLLQFGSITPLVVLLDDLHLADPETMTFLRSAARRLHDSGVLVVLGFHSAEARDTTAVWQALLAIDSQAGVDRLYLADFDAVETAEMVRALTGRSADPAMLESLQAQTGGNPLLITEALRTRADDLIGQDTALTEVASDLLTRRLDSAPGSTVRLLQAAAVSKGPVTVEQVASIAGLSRDQALRSIDDATRRVFFVERAGLLEFSHAQLKVATLAGIPPTDLSTLHARAAAWLERTDSDRFDELARHHLAAGRPYEAARAFEEAGEQAKALYAIETAVHNFQAALAAHAEAGTPEDACFDLLLGLERLLDQQGWRQQQEVVLDRLQQAATDTSGALEVARRRILLLAGTDRFDQARAEAARALEVAAGAGHDAAGVRSAMGLALAWSGHTDQALAELESLPAGDEETAEDLYVLGMVLSSFDRERANDHLGRAIALFEESNSVARQADALGLMATNNASDGDVALAEGQFREAFDLCRRIGHTRGEGLHLANLASLHYLAGRPAEALRGYEAALDRYAIVPSPRLEALALNNAAYVRHLILGDDERAHIQVSKALDYYRSVGNPRGIAQSVSILAGIQMRADPSAALEMLQRDLGALEAHGVWTATHLGRQFVEVLLACGDVDEARRQCARVRGLAASDGLSDVVASLDGLAARIEMAADDPAAALAHARRSVAAITRSVQQPYLLHFGLFRAAVDVVERQTALNTAYERLQETLVGFSPKERTRAESVPEHAMILEAWGQVQPRVRTIQLPGHNSGTVMAALTIDSPDDRLVPGKRQRRQHRLARMRREAEEQGAILSTNDIAVLLGVSSATVRRDLTALRSG